MMNASSFTHSIKHTTPLEEPLNLKNKNSQTEIDRNMKTVVCFLKPA